MTRTAAVLSALALSLASGPALAAPSQKAQDRIPPGLVDGAAARQLVADGVKVVDVRTPEEFASGHVPGAVNIPYDQMPARAGELGPPSTPVLVYCRSGRRSGVAAQTLREKGYTRLWDLQAYDRWVASGSKGK
ncbi:MAG TPA: rhodanese-like domain-containing protein [Anaeromyxobacter sp.]|nr:rhodanese-like domain-containing protein [Anaeromyxobacter sp.]